jgi:hypothetical protein
MACTKTHYDVLGTCHSPFGRYVIPLTGDQWRYVEASGLTQSFYQALLSGDYRRAHCITCSYPLR